MAESGTDYSLFAEVCALVKPKEEDPDMPGLPPIRYRPPFIGTNAHDARNDAVQLVVDNLRQQGLSTTHAQLLAQIFVDEHAENPDIRSARVPFEKDVYDSIDASVWCRKVVAAIPNFLQSIAEGKLKIPDVPASYTQFLYSVYSEKNKRSKMEDRHLCMPTMEMWGGKNDGSALFAVFDGHAGTEVSSYAAAHMPPVFEAQQGSLQDRLQNSFMELEVRTAMRCEKEHWKSGSTAVCLAVNQEELCFGWVGDSAGYLMSSTEVTKMTTDHSPNDPAEAKRIEEAGGFLTWIQGEYRVNGVLNLTRSLGDIAGRPVIISDAELNVQKRSGTEYLAILACDGISDILTETQLYDVINTFVENHEQSEYKKLGEAFCAAAKDQGSRDNLSVVVVFLRPLEDLWNLFSGDFPPSEKLQGDKTDHL